MLVQHLSYFSNIFSLKKLVTFYTCAALTNLKGITDIYPASSDLSCKVLDEMQIRFVHRPQLKNTSILYKKQYISFSFSSLHVYKRLN